jgi:cob(I)alamin adenosyltransferase
MGTGFTWDTNDREKLRRAAEKGWTLAREKIESGRYCMVILDELTYALNYGLLEQDEIIRYLERKPEHLHIIITGRDASDKLIALADLVTEMREIKHPYQKGVKAMKGIEF